MPTDLERLNAFLDTESKYNPTPAPAPVDRAIAVKFVITTLVTRTDADSVDKLTRLASLHDLRETANAFEGLLKLPDASEADFSRTLIVVTALTRLGDDKQISLARERFRAVAAKIDLVLQRNELLRAAYTVGRDDDPAFLDKIVANAVAKLKAQSADLASKGRREAAAIDGQADRLAEFRAGELRRFAEAVALQKDIDTAKDQAAAIAKCAALYIEEVPESTPLLAEWAAYRLVRFATRDKAPPNVISLELLRLARLYEKPDQERQLEFDLYRARALRAAEFFGGKLSEVDLAWKNQQPDAGKDILALRPRWEYPAHQH